MPTSATPAAPLLARPRLPALTGLRFLAALAVVFFHLGVYIGPLQPLRLVAGLGYGGVGFFFVLSGFVLAWAQGDHVAPGRFYRNRFARVWPLHLVTTLVAALPVLAWHDASRSPLTLAAVLLLVQSWSPYAAVQFAFNGVSWSLSCEAFFYAVFPLVAPRLLAASRRRLGGVVAAVVTTMVCVAVVVLALAPRQAWNALLFVNPLYRFGDFVVGMCLANAVRQGWRPRVGLRGAAALVLSTYAVLVVVADVVYDGNPVRMPLVVTDLVLLPVFGLLLTAAAWSCLDGADGRKVPLASTWWVRLGEWSFALYLVHELLVRTLVRVVSDDAPVAVAQAAVLVVVATSLAGVLHATVERPCERWLRGRRGSSARQRQPSPAGRAGPRHQRSRRAVRTTARSRGSAD